MIELPITERALDELDRAFPFLGRGAARLIVTRFMEAEGYEVEDGWQPETAKPAQRMVGRWRVEDEGRCAGGQTSGRATLRP